MAAISNGAAGGLRAFLAARFGESGGRMPFERFMELALYDPDFGYYTKHIAGVGGRRADFATAATLSPVLGEAVAKWAEGERRYHGIAGECHLIEVGGGDGRLAQAVLEAMGWWRRRKVRYHLVEISPVLEAQQRETLGRLARGGSVCWHRTIVEAIAAAQGEALVFSNELVDAFPARRFCWDAERGGVDEIWVEYDEERGIREVLVQVDEPMPDGVPAVDGQRFERHDSYRCWLESWAPAFRRGSVLTIDYGGADAGEIFAKRPMGTLRGYHRHQRGDGVLIYRHFGRQDLTCDVDFSEMRRWGEELGWETVTFETQAAFFRRQLGPDAFGGNRATAFLLDADGAGGAFKVLAQRS